MLPKILAFDYKAFPYKVVLAEVARVEVTQDFPSDFNGYDALVFHNGSSTVIDLAVRMTNNRKIPIFIDAADGGLREILKRCYDNNPNVRISSDFGTLCNNIKKYFLEKQN